MADLNSTIIRGNLRVTDEIIGPLNVVNLSTGANGQFLSISNNVPTWVDNPNTDTWRPVVDNLTSTATDQSLSANQGKVLKSYIDTYFPRAKYGNDSPYSDVSTSFIGGVGVGPRTNDWEFLYRAEHRNGAGDGPNYVMEIVSNLTSDSSIYWRKKTNSPFTAFREIIDSNNIGSQSVDYANSAGSVAWGNVSDKPFSGTSFVSGNSGNGEHNANNAIANGHYYYTSNGPATSLGASYTDGALYVQSHSDAWAGQIAQDYRNGSLFVRGKNNGSWSSWKRIIDSDNIGSQTVDYAKFIKPHQNVTSTSKSIWTPSGSGSVIWGQNFVNSSISTDTGDLVLTLRPSVYSSGNTELCMHIDGDYYSNENKMARMADISNMVTTDTAQSISGLKTFKGDESNDISFVYNGNNSISGYGRHTAIRHALSFPWYNDIYQIGNIRGDSADSLGFGITKGNSELVARFVDSSNAYIGNNSIIHSGNIGSQSVNYATSSHLLRTYDRNDSSHGEDYYLKCRHNVDGNDRFKLQIIRRSDGSITHSTSVDYANSAGSATNSQYVAILASINGEDTNTYPWRRFMSIPSTTQNYTDTFGTYYLSGNYIGGPYYLFRVEFRTNYSAGGELGSFGISVIATNSNPNDLAIASYSVVENGVTRNYSDIFIKVNCGWPRLTLTRLSAPDVGSITYYNSYEGVSASSRTEAYTGINGSGTSYASYDLYGFSEYTYVNYGVINSMLVTTNTDQSISGYKKISSIGIDTINGATLGNAIMRQNTSTGDVILGSTVRPLRLWGNGDRPTYSKDDGASYKNLALLSDLNGYLPLSGGTIDAGGSKTPLILKGGVNNFGEGLRILPTTSWATIVLGGNDSGESIGTSANSWSIHNNDGRFYISKNGSNDASTKLSNTDGTWRVNDNDIIHSGNIGSQSVNSANYFNYGRGVALANSSSFTNNFCKDIFGEEHNNNFHLVEVRTSSNAPSCLLGDYSSGIAWKGSDTYGSLMVRYNTPEIRVSGGNGANTNPNWSVDLVHSGNIGSQNVNYANSAGSANSVAWGNVTGKPAQLPLTSVFFSSSGFRYVSNILEESSSGVYYYRFMGGDVLTLVKSDNYAYVLKTLDESTDYYHYEGFFSLYVEEIINDYGELDYYDYKITMFNRNGITTFTFSSSTGTGARFSHNTSDKLELYRVR